MLTLSDEAVRAAMIDGWIQRDTAALRAVEAEIDALLRQIHELAHRGHRLSVQIAASRAALEAMKL